MSVLDADDLAGSDRLALLLAFGRIGLYTRDLGNGSGGWDRCLFEMTGLDPAAGAPDWAQFLQHVHAADRDEVDATFRAVRARPQRGELHFRFVRPDGQERLMHSLFDVRHDPAGGPGHLVGVVVDNSEAGRRLRQGERSRDFLQQALALSGASVWSIDLATQRVRFNALGFQIMGVAPDRDNVSLATLRASIHPQDRVAVLQAADAAVAGDEAVDVVARYRAQDGGWRTLLTRRIAVRDDAGRATALLGVALDLTRRDVDRARAESLAERTRLVAQAMGVGFWQLDAAADMVHWDEQMYRLHGRDPARLPPSMEEWISAYVQPQAQEEALQQLRAAVAAWAPETLMTLPIRGDDGVERWVRAWTQRFVRDGQRIAMGMHLDVTEQFRHEAVQREAERAARASRDKSAFMALMSHQLRTPLNAVLGFAQLMAQDTHDALSPRQRERLARIDAAGSELLAMIDDVFELAALDDESSPPVRSGLPLEGVITQLREWVTPLARLRGVELRFAHVPPELRVATDRRLLGQALRHLVAHAVRRNHQGGHVALQVVLEPPWARLELRDGGPGFGMQQREMLFDAPAAPGQGSAPSDPVVGLDLVRQAIERLGAELDWMQPDAADAALLVRLPLAEAADAAAPAGMTLLCIEDNPVNLMLVQELVAMRPGIQLLSAADGATGLAMAARHRPDAVLLDLHLPDIDGREVAARLRADPRTAACRVIALSANAMPDDIRSAHALGFDDYWTKPIDFDRFLAGLDAITSELRARAAP